ncbi:MAG: hypothetical protein JO050_07145 [Acidimicrobiia bacterium]|nr:hypothetical protein [Acidimicrobiia bacterium]
MLTLTDHHNGKKAAISTAGQTVQSQPTAGTGAASSTTSPAATATPTSIVNGVASGGGGAGPVATVAPPHAAPTTTAAPNPGSNSATTVVVTEADDGKTFTLHRGTQNISVQLSNDNVWTEPQASNSGVLSRTSGSTNGDGSAAASFAAVGDGQTTISADGRSHPLPCETAQPRCYVPDHIVVFQVTVNVGG